LKLTQQKPKPDTHDGKAQTQMGQQIFINDHDFGSRAQLPTLTGGTDAPIPPGTARSAADPKPADMGQKIETQIETQRAQKAQHHGSKLGAKTQRKRHCAHDRGEHDGGKQCCDTKKNMETAVEKKNPGSRNMPAKGRRPQKKPDNRWHRGDNDSAKEGRDDAPGLGSDITSVVKPSQ
jgi:hypothetical protein